MSEPNPKIHVVSTDKMPLSKLPLGVRQSTLRFRKNTEVLVSQAEKHHDDLARDRGP